MSVNGAQTRVLHACVKEIIFLNVLDYSEDSDTNIMHFFHENIAFSMRKKNNWKKKFKKNK